MDKTVPTTPFPDLMVVDDHTFARADFIAKLDQIAAEVDGDHPGWTY